MLDFRYDAATQLHMTQEVRFMSARIEDILIELSQDPFRAAQFLKDPHAETSLTSNEKDLLIGDAQQLDQVLRMAKSTNQGGRKVTKPKPKKKKAAKK